MIIAPYNFVPQNKKVFCPFWYEDVNHDIPFEDGQSGVLHLKITAKSPIFIKDSKDENIFCNYNGEFYIPSTSLKGMFRNVLEIMSFGKMNFIDNKKYSMRDLKNTKYMEKVNGAKCGWLYKENGHYKIENCDVPYRISHENLDKKFEINFENTFSNSFNSSENEMKTAKYKYTILMEKNYEPIYNFFKIGADDDPKKLLDFDDKGDIKGKIVLTGQSSPRKKQTKDKEASGKHLEFVFKIDEKAQILDLEDGVFENFKFAYFDGKETQPKESPDWTFWKKELNEGKKIPVFFHDNGKKVTSFGLSYLYKFPYEKSIEDGLEEEHLQREKLDLAELIFGYSKKIGENQRSLKGRVYISHAKLINAKEDKQASKEREIILGSPRPSYYPNYLVQTKDSKEYNTFMSENPKLSGWKRYPIHKKFKGQAIDKINSGLKNNIIALNEGSIFECKIVVHNLLPVELGALISAITFHKNSDCFHNIGMGKPLGYGKIQVEINGFDGFDKPKDEYMKIFESAINYEIFQEKTKKEDREKCFENEQKSNLHDKKEEWHESRQIVNLFTMAKEQENKENSELKYMELKEFATNKSLREGKVVNFLKPYTCLDGVTKATINKLSDEKSMQYYANFIKSYKEKQEIQAKQSLEKQKAEKIKEDTKDLDEIQKVIYELKLQPEYKDILDHRILYKAIFKLNKFEEQKNELRALERLKEMLQKMKKWKEETNAKKPEKDKDYKNTIEIINRIKTLENIIQEENN